MGHIDVYSLQAISPTNPSAPAPASYEEVLAKNLPFTSKEEYLEWRTEWRSLYRELSASIRELRIAWRAEGSDHEIRRHFDLLKARALARTMLALRRASKVRAEEQYQLAREASKVA